MIKRSKHQTRRKVYAPKECVLCKEKKAPTLFDVALLSRFQTERGKIIGRSRSGLCSKHQKQLTIAIKHARHLALLPYVGRA